MGYSYTAAAGYTLDAIQELIQTNNPEIKTSNGLPGGGFWETGRERDDGAIVGTVWKPYAPDPERVTRAGSFHIAPDGKVKRFPRLPRTMLETAEALSAAKYERYHGPRAA